jgi:hypothetical protein
VLMDSLDEITFERLSLEKFEKMFGKVRPNVCKTLTQDFLKSYHRLDYDGKMEKPLVTGFGLDWIGKLLEYNESVEEYEICAILHKLIEKYK